MTIAEFRDSEHGRQRYWARSFIGWPRMRQALANDGHHALARLQAAGAVGTIITQNVDTLHQAAGASDVIDLHGRLDTVICLSCGQRTSRLVLQQRLAEANPDFAATVAEQELQAAPDGDIDGISGDGFHIAACLHCGGILKPDVVFFGENVPADRVQRCYDAVMAAPSLLVIGSSLTVMSGLRFVKRAAARPIPIAIINRGATRGDALASVVLDEGATPALTELARTLS